MSRGGHACKCLHEQGAFADAGIAPNEDDAARTMPHPALGPARSRRLQPWLQVTWISARGTREGESSLALATERPREVVTSFSTMVFHSPQPGSVPSIWGVVYCSVGRQREFRSSRGSPKKRQFTAEIAEVAEALRGRRTPSSSDHASKRGAAISRKILAVRPAPLRSLRPQRCNILACMVKSSMADTQSRYRSVSSWLKETFGEPVRKINLDAGLGCPNRDGTLGRKRLHLLQSSRFRHWSPGSRLHYSGTSGGRDSLFCPSVTSARNS